MKSEERKQSIPDFNRTQLHVMQILWDAEESLKPGEIEERFDWKIDNATLRSVLKVLLERGELNREQKGKAYFYFPVEKRQSALSTLMAGVAKVFTKGSKAGLIAQLLQDTSLTDEERKTLEQLAKGGGVARGAEESSE